MRNHAVSTTKRVLHRAPDVVARSGLLVPNVTGIATELTRFECSSDSVLVTDGTASSIDEPSSLLEVREELSVNEVAGSVVERGVDGDDIASGNELLQVLDTASTDSLGSLCRSPSIIIVNTRKM